MQTAKRVDIKSSHHKKKITMWHDCCIVVIVLQICIYQIMYIWSNKMSYVNYILIKWGKGKKGVIRIQEQKRRASNDWELGAAAPGTEC